MRPEEIWYGKTRGAEILRGALLPLSWLYAGGWNLYESMYRLGLKRAAEPHVPVLCVGNLTAGGSGKTPLVAYLARGIRSRLGREVVIGCSGYGSPRSEAAQIAPEGPLSASEWGDEAALFRELEPGVPLVVGRRRVLAAELVHKSFPDSVLLMDDGMQHLPLKKHATILVDPYRGTSHTFPAGPYREPRSHRSRADLLIPDQYALELRTQVLGVSGEVQALCAIGDPERFRSDLTGLGLTVVRLQALPDHDPLTSTDLFKGLRPELPVIVTGKDWVKLKGRPDLGGWNIHVATQSCRVDPEEAFWDRVRAVLDAKT